MRAVVCEAFGPPEDLRIGELPEPTPGPGEVAIAVHAAGVSFADTLMIRDMHQNKHALPFAPGMEVAGRVVALGEGAEGLSVGDRVMALVYDGAYAETAVAPARETFRIPDAMPFEAAAAMGSVHLTSHVALRWEGRLARDERLLVLGAAGGVGLAAVELGKAMGAVVIAAASTPEKRAVAGERGADHVVDYTSVDLREAVGDLTGGEGVDVVFDPVAGPWHESAFRSLGWGGRHLIVGFAGGAIPKFPANHLLVKNRSAVGVALFHYRKRRFDLLAQSAQECFAWWGEGKVVPHVDTVLPLEEAGAGLRRVMDRQVVGKVVLQVRA